MLLDERTPRLARLLCTLALPLMFLGAPRAEAYERTDLPWPCAYAKWDQDIPIGFIDVSFSTDFVRAAVEEPGLRINAVDGQSLDFIHWSVFGDNAPSSHRNEIWKSSGLGQGVIAMTSRRYSFCKPAEADIIFATSAQAGWHHGEPGHYGTNYWQRTDTQSVKYLRHQALHELLHVAGFEHEDNDYSFTNHGQRPWAHRGAGYQAEPLPTDRRGLRVVYDTSGGEPDVGVLNTHVIANNSGGIGAMNCYPSTGNNFSQFWSGSGFCGNSFSNQVCPGDRVYTSYTAVNYGTWSTETTQRLHFSANSVLGNADTVSPTEWEEGLAAGRVEHQRHSFIVPDIPAGTYWPIIEIDTFLPEESTWNNWIPLRRQIVVPSSCFD